MKTLIFSLVVCVGFVNVGYAGGGATRDHHVRHNKRPQEAQPAQEPMNAPQPHAEPSPSITDMHSASDLPAPAVAKPDTPERLSKKELRKALRKELRKPAAPKMSTGGIILVVCGATFVIGLLLLIIGLGAFSYGLILVGEILMLFGLLGVLVGLPFALMDL